MNYMDMAKAALRCFKWQKAANIKEIRIDIQHGIYAVEFFNGDVYNNIIT